MTAPLNIEPLFIDIETVKTKRPDYRDRVAKTIKPPAQMSKPETIAKWEAEQKEGAIDEAIEKSVFNGGLCHIAQIQYAHGDGDIVVLQGQEEEILPSFFQFLADNDLNVKSFVGHNISGFDIRVLKQRACVLGMRVPNVLARAIRSKPWDGLIFDTMLEWSGSYKDWVSMDNLCYYLGIDTPKGVVDGASFGKHYEAGEMEMLKQYGIDEIVALKSVYKLLK